MRDHVDRLLAARSVALVGATERSSWSRNAVENLRRHAPDVEIHLVSPRHDSAHGMATVPTLGDLPAPVDLAYIMSPRDTVPETIRSAGAAGVANAVVLTAGFGEIADGVALQRELTAAARESGVNVMGPNTSGFVNLQAPLVVCGLSLPVVPDPGPASFVLHSGGMMKPIMSLARAWGFGVGFVGGTGNEVDLTATDLATALVAADDVRAIGMFLESVRDPEEFRALAAQALEADCPLVVLTVGRSEVARESAVSHTGAMTGDAEVTEAALRDVGVVQVRSLEELVATTGLLSRGVRPRGRRLAVIGASGGVCELTAETADGLGLELPQPAEDVVADLVELLPDFGHARNPLDVTGYVAIDPRLAPAAMEAFARDGSSFDLLLFQAFMMPTTRPAEPGFLEESLGEVARMADKLDIPVLLQGEISTTLSDYGRELFAELGLTWLPGVETGLRAVAGGADYAARRAALGHAPTPVPPGALRVTVTQETWSEAEALACLAGAGVPTVPHHLVTTSAEAAQAAAEIGGTVAMKICSADIPHKTDVGGVRLGVPAPEAGAVFDDLVAQVRRSTAPGTSVDGVLVSPMRAGGVELVAGLRNDPMWGPVLVVGLGGVWIELLGDYVLGLAPVTPARAREMLLSLRGAALLTGHRGAPPIDLDAAAHCLASLSRLGVSLESPGWTWSSIEINPLRADESGVEALDALVTWTRGENAGEEA